MKVDDRLIDLWSFADDPPRVRIVQRIVAPMSWAIGFLSQGFGSPSGFVGPCAAAFDWHRVSAG